MSPARLLLLTALPALAVAGCRPSETDGFTPGTGAVPAVLQEMEQQAEDAFDLALAGDLRGVSASAVRLETDWKAYRSRLPAGDAGNQVAPMMDRDIASLVETAGRSTDRIRLARNVNRITGLIADLCRAYAPPVPPAVSILDVLGRDLLLDGMTGDLDGARDHLVLFRNEWDLLRDTVLHAGEGSDVAARFDETTEALARAVQEESAERIRQTAGDCLKGVDALEQMF